MHLELLALIPVLFLPKTYEYDQYIVSFGNSGVLLSRKDSDTMNMFSDTVNIVGLFIYAF